MKRGIKRDILRRVKNIRAELIALNIDGGWKVIGLPPSTFWHIPCNEGRSQLASICFGLINGYLRRGDRCLSSRLSEKEWRVIELIGIAGK